MSLLTSASSVQAGGSVVGWGYNSWGQTNIPPSLANVIAIAAADDQSLALTADGTLAQWGEFTGLPVGLVNVLAISSGADPFNLALRSDGTVAAWGGNDYGCSSIPPGLGGVVAIAAGYVHSLALKGDGTVVAWGDNSTGQTNVPTWLSNVVAVAAGEFNSLALRNDGTVVGWGDNFEGESTGVATFSPPTTNGIVTLQGQVLSNVVAIAAGVGRFSLGLKRDGTVISWGSPDYHTPPPGLTNVIAIAAGSDFALALKADGTVVAWGLSFFGATNVPSGLTNVVAIAAGIDHGLALLGDGPPDVASLMSNLAWDAAGFHGTIATRSGRVYSFEFKNSLSDAAWTALPLTCGTGRQVTLTDPTATGRQRFYRVRQW